MPSVILFVAIVSVLGQAMALKTNSDPGRAHSGSPKSSAVPKSSPKAKRSKRYVDLKWHVVEKAWHLPGPTAEGGLDKPPTTKYCLCKHMGSEGLSCNTDVKGWGCYTGFDEKAYFTSMANTKTTVIKGVIEQLKSEKGLCGNCTDRFCVVPDDGDWVYSEKSDSPGMWKPADECNTAVLREEGRYTDSSREWHSRDSRGSRGSGGSGSSEKYFTPQAKSEDLYLTPQGVAEESEELKEVKEEQFPLLEDKEGPPQPTSSYQSPFQSQSHQDTFDQDSQGNKVARI